MNKDDFFKEFLAFSGEAADTKYIECFHFDVTEKSANHLLDLVLSGTKKATSSSLLAYKGAEEEIPKVGDYSIVTDWNGTPRCVIKTTAVMILPYKEMTYEICKREGEDDTLESWQEGHERFFTEDGKQLGYEFSKDMPVIFEDFEVVYKS